MDSVVVTKARDLGLTLEPRAYPVPKAKFSLPVYWSLRGRQVWAPLRYRNSGVFYGEREHLDALLTRLTARPQKDGQWFEIAYYSFQPLKSFPKKRYFSAHTVTVGLERFLEELLSFKAELDREAGATPGRELNRKVSMIFLDLSPQELSELAKPGVEEKLLRLLENADRLRLHFFLTCQDAKMVRPTVLAALDWKAYLGEDNFTFGNLHHSELESEPYNVNRKLIGLLVDSALNVRLPVHDIAYEPSGHKKASDVVAGAEERAFKALLDSF